MTTATAPSIRRIAAGGFGVALAVLFAVLAFAQLSIERLFRATDWVEHTHYVLESIDSLDRLMVDAETGQRGYLLTGRAEYLAPYHEAVTRVSPTLLRLRALTRDNALQQARLDTLQRLAEAKLAELAETIAEYDRGAPAAALQEVRTGRGMRLMSEIRALAERLTGEERRLLAERARDRGRLRKKVRAAVVGGIALALLVAAVSLRRLRAALEERRRAERERDRERDTVQLQAEELEAQNEELSAQGEALHLAMSLAEDANQAKSVFLAQMSHELRTPLNSVIGFANIVLRNARDTLGREEVVYLERIVDNGRQLLRTINSILDLSKIESRQETVHVAPVPLCELLEGVVAQLEPQARAGSVTVSSECPPSLLPLQTDGDKLRHVVVNLAANAVKFTRPGGRVVVRAVADRASGERAAAIEVEDSGIGIAAARLAAIFEPFEQGDVGVTREFGGTGLGLTIARALCDTLGYTLTVRSTVGVGSVFRVTLGDGSV